MSRIDLTPWNLIPGKPEFKTVAGQSIFGSGDITINGGVPYTGATQTLDMGLYDVQATRFKFGSTGPQLDNSGGTIRARTNNGLADAPISASTLTVSGSISHASAGLDLKAASGWVTLYEGLNCTFGARNSYGAVVFNGNRLGFESGSVGIADAYLGRSQANELAVYIDRQTVSNTLGNFKAANVTASGTITVGGDLIVGSSGGPRLRNSSGTLLLRNNADTANGNVQVGELGFGPGGNCFYANSNYHLVAWNGAVIGWSAASGVGNGATLESGFSRLGSASIALGNGTAGNASGSLTLANLTTNRATNSSFGVYACGKNSNGYVDWELNEGLAAGYGGSLTLRAGDAANTGYMRLRYDAGYPKIESTGGLTFTGGGRIRMGGTYIDMGAGSDATNWLYLNGITNLSRATNGFESRNADNTAYAPIKFGFISLSADPTTLDLASGGVSVYKNTTSGALKLWANDGGTMKSVALT